MDGPAQLSASPPQEFKFTDRDFDLISGLVHKNYGLSLTDAKKPLVYSRLIKRLRFLNIESFEAYCDFVISPAGEVERNRMLSALTTNVSHFFREKHHFELMETTILPPLIARARTGGRVRLWSAGCSAGQEPYSIAFTVLKLCPNADSLDFKILATDIDDDILAKAKSGLYAQEDVGKLDGSNENWLTPTSEDGHAKYEVKPLPKKLISFTKLNLVGEWPQTNQFDMIFCRNVAIYFDRETQSRLWSRFAKRLMPDGFLIIGHSERLTPNIGNLFEIAGITAYRKKSEA